MRRILWLSFLLCLLPQIAIAEVKSITLAGSERFNYNNVDKTGLYWDIINAIFTEKGVTISYQNLPYLIAAQQVSEKKIDGAFVYAKQPPRNVLYSEQPMDHITLVALFKTDRNPDFKGMPSLEKKIVAIYKGYDFESMMGVPFTKNSFTELETGLKKVRDTYADFLIDYEEDIKVASEAAFLDLSTFSMKPVIDFDVYFIASDTPQGKEVMDMFNKGMKELVSSGKLEKMRDKWTTKKSTH